MRASNYRFEYSDDSGVLFFQFNRVSDEEEESIEEFTGRLSAFVDEHDIDRLVIDLRSNGGGDNQLIEPLLSLISGHPKIDRRGILYTLIGRRTYSAAGSFATALERRTRTLFAGEPSGFTPNHLGDAVTIPLPRSRVLVNVSTRYWENDGPFGRRPCQQREVLLSRAAHKRVRVLPVLSAGIR